MTPSTFNNQTHNNNSRGESIQGRRIYSQQSKRIKRSASSFKSTVKDYGNKRKRVQEKRLRLKNRGKFNI